MSAESFGTEGVVIPDLPEPITAYRAWTFDEGDLMGYGGTCWPTHGDRLTAGCGGIQPTVHRQSGPTYSWSMPRWESYGTPCIESPSPSGDNHAGYGCGIYGYKDARHMVEHSSGRPSTVWGTVELWGRVYEHDHGYRAEHARITGIFRAPNGLAAQRAAEVYGVPLLDLPVSQAELDAIYAERAAESAARRTASLSVAVDVAKIKADIDRELAALARVHVEQDAKRKAKATTESRWRIVRWSKRHPVLAFVAYFSVIFAQSFGFAAAKDLFAFDPPTWVTFTRAAAIGLVAYLTLLRPAISGAIARWEARRG